MTGKSIRLFLAEGTPHGLISAEIRVPGSEHIITETGE